MKTNGHHLPRPWSHKHRPGVRRPSLALRCNASLHAMVALLRRLVAGRRITGPLGDAKIAVATGFSLPLQFGLPPRIFRIVPGRTTSPVSLVASSATSTGASCRVAKRPRGCRRPSCRPARPVVAVASIAISTGSDREARRTGRNPPGQGVAPRETGRRDHNRRGVRRGPAISDQRDMSARPSGHTSYRPVPDGRPERAGCPRGRTCHARAAPGGRRARPRCRNHCRRCHRRRLRWRGDDRRFRRRSACCRGRWRHRCRSRRPPDSGRALR